MLKDKVFLKGKQLHLAWMIIVVFFIPLISVCQPSTHSIPTQRLLLKLASSYLNAAEQGQIDIDSALVLASGRLHLNRMLVIAEYYQDIANEPANKWIISEDIQSGKKLADRVSGLQRIKILNLIGSFYAFQASGRRKDLDSAFRILTMASREAQASGYSQEYYRSLNIMGKCFLEANELDSAAVYFNRSIEYSSKSGDKQSQSMALTYWAVYSPFQPGTIVQRIDQLRKANSLFKEINDSENMIVTETDIGYLSLPAGRLQESEKAFLNTLDAQKRIHFPFTEYTTDILALISSLFGKFGTSFNYSLQTVQTAEALADSAALGHFYARLASPNMDLKEGVDSADYMNKLDRALEWEYKALGEFKKYGGAANIYSLASNMSDKLVRKNKSREAIDLLQETLSKYPTENPVQKQHLLMSLGRGYFNIRDFSSSERYLLEAEKLQPKVYMMAGNIRAGNLYYSLGDLYFATGQFSKSKDYFKKAISISSEITSTPLLMQYSYQKIAYIDSLEGNYQEALFFTRKTIDIKDSLNNQIQNKQLSQLRLQYETSKKDADIKLLSQQTAIQKSELKRATLAKNLTIGGIILSLIILGLLFYQYRLKQRNNKIISLKNHVLQHMVTEKEWLLKEVHHRVKNNLQTIVSLLELQSEYLQSEALSAIHDSQNRIYAMALIHQKLYQSENIASISMPSYLKELIGHLREIYKAGSVINFKLDITPVELDISQAIPIGLIVNEAVTNSIKYAIGDTNKELEVSVSLKEYSNQQLMMVIADDGIGLPAGFEQKMASGLGLKLIQALVTDVDGDIRILSDSGTRIIVRFKASAPFQDSKYLKNEPQKALA